MVIRKEGEIMPTFYYGLAYTKWECYHQVYYIIPFNYFVRWKRFIHHWWMANIQQRKTWFDKEIQGIRAEKTKRYIESIDSSNAAATKYRHAYYEVMTALHKTDTPKEEIQRLFELG